MLQYNWWKRRWSQRGQKDCLVYVVEENKLLLRACHWLHVFFFLFHWIKFRGVAVAVIGFCGLRFLKIKIRGFARQNSQQLQEPRVIIARQSCLTMVCLLRCGTSFLPQANIMISYYTRKQMSYVPSLRSVWNFLPCKSINQRTCVLKGTQNYKESFH